MSALPTSETLDFDLADGWLTVWFNSPEENRNALTDERAAELLALCGALQDRRDIRGVTIRGKGAVFCAGGDLKSFKRAITGNAMRDDTVEMSRKAGKLYAAVNSLPQITIMAVEGPCVAGGLGLASCGDFILATADAKFSLTEVRIGLSPAQIAPFVVSRIGLAAMRRLALTGAMFGAEEAREIGLIDGAFDDAGAMNDAVASIVADSRSCAPGAVAATKSLLLDLESLNRDERRERAAQTFTDCMFSVEGREGLTAFAEKRKPDWQALYREAG